MAPVLRGYRRRALLRDLAMGELSPRELAKKHDITIQDVLSTKETEAENIRELSQALSGTLNIEVAGLWIAQKQNRLAELEHEASEIREALRNLREDQRILWSRSHRDMIRTYIELLKTVADELGAYPQRDRTPQKLGQAVHYVIDTGDEEASEALR